MLRPPPSSTLFPYTTLFRSLVLRGDRQLRVTLAPKPYPLQWTTMAGPPKIDAPAPAVTLTSYRGNVPPKLADGSADRKSTRLNSSHRTISYAVFRLKKKNDH